jgi:hypothetical protein
MDAVRALQKSLEKRCYKALLVAGTISFSSAIALCTSPAFADDQPVPTATNAAPAAQETPPEKVRTGVIASDTKTGQFAAIDVDTGGDSPGDEVNPITASITRGSDDECTAKVTNNGKNTYSISFAVAGTTRSGSKPLNSTYSATLKPKETVERRVSRCDKDLNLAVVLKSAKALKK